MYNGVNAYVSLHRFLFNLMEQGEMLRYVPDNMFFFPVQKDLNEGVSSCTDFENVNSMEAGCTVSGGVVQY